MHDPVECRSNDLYADRPTALWWAGERLPVARILSRWRSPAGRGFRVCTPDELVFELFYDEAADEWRVELKS
ncbi:hypothetical protein ACFLZW_07880 [Chloroflexota bacterium]